MHLYLWTSWKISIVYVCRRKQHTEGGHLKDRADLQSVRSEINCAKHIWLLICCPVKKTKLLCVLWTKETSLCSSVSIKWENFLYYFQFEVLVSSQLLTLPGFQPGCFLSSLLCGSYGASYEPVHATSQNSIYTVSLKLCWCTGPAVLCVVLTL